MPQAVKSMILNKTLLLVLVITVSKSIFAQGPVNWYFGQKAGILFNGGVTVTFLSGSQMSTPEGCSVYESSPSSADFYTNGEKIWDINGGIISNGNNLFGSMNSCQSSLFYHTSMSDTLYLFTTDDHNGTHGLCYNVFVGVSNQMVLVSKNNSLLPSSTERMTLTNHCDEKSMWLVSHQWNSNAFYTYKIDKDSLESTPIISNVGSVHNGNSLNAKGCMKINTNGTKLALAKMKDGVVELFHFDNVHGVVSDPIMLSGIPNAYGIEFSLSGDMLYVSTVTGQLLQFNVNHWDQDSIADSKIVISSQSKLLGSLQIGPDDMIYLAQDNDFYLGRIELPENTGISCTYNPTAVYLNGHKGEAGLPQTYRKKPGFDINVPVECLGDTSFFHTMGDVTKLDSVKWYFWDGTTIIDSSNLLDPFQIYDELGNYHVTLLLYHCDTVDTLSSETSIIGPPIANLGPDTSFCSNDIITLDGGSATSYLWDDNSSYSTRTVSSPGVYWVCISTSCGTSCDTIEILNIYDVPIVELPNDTIICSGDSIILDAGNDSTMHLWQNNDTSQFFIVKAAGYYQLNKTDSNGCKAMDGFNVQVEEAPYINLGPDTTLCIGFDLLFNGSSQGNYLWQDGSSDTTYYVNSPGIYSVSVSNLCGQATDSCEVLYEDCKQVIWIPNAFTPNGDGLNDKFKPYIENVDYFHLYIFDRWGELIFETQNINEGWDGLYKGRKAMEGSYGWRIDYTNYSDEKYKKYGFVILYR